MSTATAATTHRHHVVVVGAGVAGLAAVRALRGAPVDVTVVDARDHHTFQPLLFQVAAASLAAEDVTVRITRLLRRQPHARFRRGRVVAIDTAARAVRLADGASLAYDSLVVAAGAVSDDFAVPGVDAHGLALKTVADALAIRSQVLRGLEEDTTSARPVVVAGAGPTGVEMAGALAELLADRWSDLAPLGTTRPRVVLVEPTDAVLPSYAPATQAYAERALRARGVELRLHTSVTAVEPDAVTLSDGTRIDRATLVWAAGVRAHPLARALTAAPSRGGRVSVTDRLHLADRPDVFVVGDLAGPAGDAPALPQVAQVAMQMGAHAGRVIRDRLRGRTARPFRYADRGRMAIVGRGAGAAELARRLGGMRVRGVIGWLAWLALHLLYLPGAANRARVLATWWLELTQRERAADLVLDRCTQTTGRATASTPAAPATASASADGWHRAA